MSDEGFISRWSRRKTEAKQDDAKSGVAPEQPATGAPPAVTPAQGPGTPAQPAPASLEPGGGSALPPVESLTPESDFTPFMKPGVDADTRRAAAKMLFQDPRFNVMDGLDVYIDDYSKPDPLPEGWLALMNQVARLGEYREPDPAAEAEPAEKADEEQPVAGSADEHAADVAKRDSRATEGKDSPPHG
jgi:hypothetical protein